MAIPAATLANDSSTTRADQLSLAHVDTAINEAITKGEFIVCVQRKLLTPSVQKQLTTLGYKVYQDGTPNGWLIDWSKA